MVFVYFNFLSDKVNWGDIGGWIVRCVVFAAVYLMKVVGFWRNVTGWGLTVFREFGKVGRFGVSILVFLSWEVLNFA